MKAGLMEINRFVPLVLAVLLLGAYAFLPVVYQPERGATTPYVLTESRDSNEIGMATSGIQLIAMAGLGALCLGIANIVAPKFARTIAILTATCGVVALSYFVIFFQDYQREAAAFLESMGAGFWLMLALSVLLVAQIALPRAKPEPRHEVRRVLGNQESVLLF